MDQKDFDQTLDLTKIKQMSFYLDNVIITDQLFKLTQPINNQQDIFTKFSLGIEKDRISVKATTEEWLGFTGREEGMKSYAVVLLIKK